LKVLKVSNKLEKANSHVRQASLCSIYEVAFIKAHLKQL
jgi:hypothetical protein